MVHGTPVEGHRGKKAVLDQLAHQVGVIWLLEGFLNTRSQLTSLHFPAILIYMHFIPFLRHIFRRKILDIKTTIRRSFFLLALVKSDNNFDVVSIDGHGLERWGGSKKFICHVIHLIWLNKVQKFWRGVNKLLGLFLASSRGEGSIKFFLGGVDPF